MSEEGGKEGENERQRCKRNELMHDSLQSSPLASRESRGAHLLGEDAHLPPQFGVLLPAQPELSLVPILEVQDLPVGILQ